MKLKETLTYDDVLLEPKYSDIKSRKEVDISNELHKNIHNYNKMTITTQAIAKVQDMAIKQNLVDHGLRIMVVGGGCSGFSYDMDFDEGEQPGDFVLEEDGLKIFVDPMSFQYLDGTKVDYIESFKFSGFHFENPNASRTCGCGSSFAV